MALAGSLQVCHHLADCAAGIQLAQPGRGIRVRVVRCLLLLDIDQNDRDIQVSDCGKHVVGGRIGQKLQDHQIHICRAELVAGLHGQFLGCNDPAVDDLDCVRKGLLECFILPLEFRNEGWELGKIRTQRDREYSDSCLCVYQHVNSS